MKTLTKLFGFFFLFIFVPSIAMAAESAPSITCQFIWQKDPMNTSDKPVILHSKRVVIPRISVLSDRSNVYGGEINFSLPNGVSLISNFYGYSGRRNYTGVNLYIKAAAATLNATSSFNNFESIRKSKATASTSYVTPQGPVYTGQCWLNGRSQN